MDNTIFLIMWVVYLVIAWILYHKIFDVVYFDLKAGCMGELVGCGIIGMILAYCTLHFWKISILIVVIVSVIAFLCCKTAESKGLVIIAAIILMIVVAVAGIKFNKDIKEKDENKTAQNTIIHEITSEYIV